MFSSGPHSADMMMMNVLPRYLYIFCVNSALARLKLDKEKFLLLTTPRQWLVYVQLIEEFFFVLFKICINSNTNNFTIEVNMFCLYKYLIILKVT